MMSHILLLLAPSLTALLWLWLLKRDRRREFIQNRLSALTGKKDDVDEGPQLERQLRQAAAYTVLLPAQLQERLNAAFDTTGNSIGILHLLAGALTGAAVTFLFTSRVLQVPFSIVMLLTVIAAAISPFVVLVIAKSRYQRRFLDVFPDALDLIRRSVKAGLPVNEALHAAGQEIPDPVGEQLRHSFEQVQVGIPMIVALEATAKRIRIPDFQFMVVALALQEKTGGSLAETLANLSGVIRGRKILRLKARGLSSEAKASAAVLTVIPFLVGGAMAVMNRDLANMLFVDPRGYRMLGVAVLSLLTGLLTMFVIVKRALR